MSYLINREGSCRRLPAGLLALLSMTALLVPAVATSAATVVRNALGTNGDFEYDGGGGLGEGWTGYASTSAAVITVGLDGTTATSGTHSQRFTVASSTGWGVYDASALVGVGGQAQIHVGDTVTMSGDVKTSSVMINVGYQLSVRCLDVNHNVLSTTLVVPNSSNVLGSWTHYSGSLTVPSGTAYVSPDFWVSAAAAGASGTVWLDNVVVGNGLTAQIPAPHNRSIRTAVTAYVTDSAWDWYEVASRFDVVILAADAGDMIHTLRMYNPSIQVYAYTSGPGVLNNAGQTGWPVDYSYANTYHPEWFLTDSTGARQTSPTYTNTYWCDPGSASFQSAWVSGALAKLQSQPWNGVFIDDCAESYLWLASTFSTQYPNNTVWQNAMTGFLSTLGSGLHAAGFQVIGNFGESDWSQPPFNAWLQYLDGGYEENAYFRAKGSLVAQYVGTDFWTPEILSPALLPSKAYVANAQVYTTDTPDLRFALASYLLGETSTSSFSTSSFGASGLFGTWQWSTDLEAPIGQPTGSLVNNGSGVYSRTFANGFVAANSDPTYSHSITLAQQYQDLSGTLYSAGAVTLSPLQGLVLLNSPSGSSTPPPSVSNATINNGATSTTSPNVTLDLVSAASAQVAVKNDTDPGYTILPSASSLPWTLTAGNGTKTLFLHFIDASGNWGATYTLAIQLNAPTVASATINNGATSTTSPSVTLNLVSTGSVQVAVKNDTDAGYTILPFSSVLPWTLTAGNGTKTLFLHFIDASGNWSATYTLTIQLNAPTVVSATINNGATSTTSPSVTLNLVSTGSVQVAVKNDTDAGYTILPFSSVLPWTLTAGNGTKTLFLHFIDASGNWGATYTLTIQLS